MANVLFDTMLPEVQPHVGGAPEPLVINAIRSAVIEFCNLAWCWQVDTDPMPVGANVQDYTIDASLLPSGSTIATIMYGYFNAIPISPITKEDVVREFPLWKTQTGVSPKRFLAGDVMTKVSLIPIPSGNQVGSSNIIPAGLFFTLALKPKRSSTGFPDFIDERYREDIAHGAIGRVMAIPHKQWSNANLALSHLVMFREKASAARQDSMKSYTRARLRTHTSGVASW